MHLQTCFVPPVSFVWLIGLSRQPGSFVIGRCAGRGLPAERTYERQQHPAAFSGEHRMHSYYMASLSSHIIPKIDTYTKPGKASRSEPVRSIERKVGVTKNYGMRMITLKPRLHNLQLFFI